MRRREARHVGSILDRLLDKWEKGPARKGSAVLEAWDAAAGKHTADHARPVNFRKGVITVLVDNSTWLYKLTLEKRKILERFNAEYSGRKKAQDIRFRVGEVKEEV